MTNVFRWIALTLVIASVGLEVRAQTSEPGRVLVRLDAGRSGAALDEVRSVFTTALDDYRAVGVAMQDQRTFPAGLMVGGAVLARVVPGLRVGFAGRFVRTDAVSLYGDYAGTVDLRGSTSATFLNLASEYDLYRGQEFVPFVGVEGGLMTARTRYEQHLELAYEDLQPPVSTTYVLNATGTGFNVEMAAGARYATGAVSVLVRGGYRIARSSKADLSERAGGFGSQEEADFEHDFGGFSLGIGVSIEI